GGAGFEVRNLRTGKASSLPLLAGRAFAFSSDSKAIAVAAEDGYLDLLDVATGKETQSFIGPGDRVVVDSVALNADGKYLAAAGAQVMDKDKDKDDAKPFVRVILWDAGKKDKLKQIDLPGREIRNLVFLPDNKTLVAQVGSRLVGWSVPSLQRIDKIKHE